MAENLTIARPYAKAIFELANAEHCVEEWEQILQLLADVANDPHARALFDNPEIKNEQLQNLFDQIIEEALPKLPKTRNKEIKNLLALLMADKRTAVLPSIFQRYQQLLIAQRQLKEVTVTSAYALDDRRKTGMTETLTRYLNSKVVVDFREDPNLIGGVIIRMGNWVMDGSIKGKLQRLGDNLQG